MLIKCLPVGYLEANCYVVTDEKTLKCAVIDPGDESNTILDYIESNHLDLAAILITHGHFDHTGAAETVSEETKASIYMSADDAVIQGDSGHYKFSPTEDTHFITEGDIIEVGELKFNVIKTPGHSPGSLTFMCEDAMFTGDTLFHGGCGRTDLDGGDMETLMSSLRKLSMIPGNYEVWPGHMDPSTLDVERESNYYMRYAAEK